MNLPKNLDKVICAYTNVKWFFQTKFRDYLIPINLKVFIFMNDCLSLIIFTESKNTHTYLNIEMFSFKLPIFNLSKKLSESKKEFKRNKIVLLELQDKIPITLKSPLQSLCLHLNKIHIQ